MQVERFIDYTARCGDSFDELALQMFDDEKQAHIIIVSNPDFADVIIFEGGEQLKLPILAAQDVPSTLPPWRRGGNQ